MQEDEKTRPACYLALKSAPVNPFENCAVPLDGLPEIESDSFEGMPARYRTMRWSVFGLVVFVATAVVVGPVVWWAVNEEDPVPGIFWILLAAIVLGLCVWAIEEWKGFSIRGVLVRDRDLTFRSGYWVFEELTVPFSTAKFRRVRCHGGSKFVPLNCIRQAVPVQIFAFREWMWNKQNASGQCWMNEQAEEHSMSTLFSEPRRQHVLSVVRFFVKNGWTFLRSFWPAFAGLAFNENIRLYSGAAIALIVVLLSVAAMIEHWKYTFHIENAALVIHRGLIEREKLVIPIERIQAVHTEQSWWQRIFGLNGLRVDTAGSAGAEVEISALRTDLANQLRHILSKESPKTTSERAVPPLIHLADAAQNRINAKSSPECGHFFRRGLGVHGAFRGCGQLDQRCGFTGMEGFNSCTLGVVYTAWDFTIWYGRRPRFHVRSCNQIPPITGKD
jgi:membrane protein YdbS with pleckstrin-like domain